MPVMHYISTNFGVGSSMQTQIHKHTVSTRSRRFQVIAVSHIFSSRTESYLCDSVDNVSHVYSCMGIHIYTVSQKSIPPKQQ